MLLVSRFKTAVKSRLHPDTLGYMTVAWTWRLMRYPVHTYRSIAFAIRKDSRFPVEQLPSASLLPTHLLDAVVERWHPRSLLDIGCGTGRAMEYLMAKGVMG
jgi:hypothetical protein